MNDERPKIPWLVQHSQDNPPKLSPNWVTVTACCSHCAAMEYAATIAKAMPRPFWVHVAPEAPILHHPNGVPIMCRSYQIAERHPSISLSA